jgi:hypothetical protein
LINNQLICFYKTLKANPPNKKAPLQSGAFLFYATARGYVQVTTMGLLSELTPAALAAA